MAAKEDEKMALILVDKPDDTSTHTKRELHVLDEDTYLENLERIITKDFYPDLPKLQAQAEYLDAVERKDTQKMWELQQKFSRKRTAFRTPGVSVGSTPSTFDTPETKAGKTPVRAEKTAADSLASADDEHPTHNPEPDDAAEEALKEVSLDKFLARNTSEDNVSFSEIMAEAEKKQRLKHAWLYEKVDEQLEEQERSLALPSIERQAIEAPPGGVQTWTYVPKNALMYVPEGVDDTAEERIDKANNAREIVHKNTRFTLTPYNVDKNKQSLSGAQARVLSGQIGPDGKEILPAQSPRVGGYGFVATPSPAPGVDASPLMTWGEIEGTPFRLDGSDTPVVPSGRGPTFKIPEVPRRDRLLHELAEKASKSHRAKKEVALKQATASLSSPSPKFGSSKTDRLQFLSPAAQSLASKKLGIRTSTDRALEASYTPSPSHRTPGSKTPTVATPSPGTTPSQAAKTPTGRSTTKRQETNKESLTDNLLNLPKRAKARDFF